MDTFFRKYIVTGAECIGGIELLLITLILLIPYMNAFPLLISEFICSF